MMRQMRENTKWIMLATAVAFVALMVFEWGMDITGRSSVGFGELGRVNGVPITSEMYQNTYRRLYDQIASGQRDPLTSAQIKQIEEAAWTDVVNQILIQQELARRGIKVSDHEIRQAAQIAPPPELMQDPYFQTDGRFDIQKYRDFLARSADQTFLLQLEGYYREIIPRSKLLRQITAGVYFSDGELWDLYREEHEQVRLRFVALDPELRIMDSQVQVSDREVREYYRRRRQDFQIPARAQVKFLFLTKLPLREDTASARERVSELRRRILAGADFAEVARTSSADQATASAGGDLGIVRRGEMVPAFDSVAFSIRLNEISPPTETPFGYHLIQVLRRWQDSAQVRHILIPIQRTEESEDRLLELVDSMETLGTTRKLQEVGALLGLPVQSQEITEAFPFLPGVGLISDGLDWVFREGFPGEVSPVFEDPTAFYILELVSVTPAGTQTLEEARPTIEQVLRQQKKVALAREEANRLLEKAREAGTLEVVDNGTDLRVLEAGPGSRSSFFAGLGVENPAVGAAFGLAEGKIGGPVVTETNVYLIQTVQRIPADSTEWEAQREEQRLRLTFLAQQRRLEQWLEGLREVAEIQDRRAQLLQASRRSDTLSYF